MLAHIPLLRLAEQDRSVPKHAGVDACHKLCITECKCWMICGRKKKHRTKNIKFTNVFLSKFLRKICYYSVLLVYDTLQLDRFLTFRRSHCLFLYQPYLLGQLCSPQLWCQHTRLHGDITKKNTS